MTRPLSPQEQETLERFNRWLSKLFRFNIAKLIGQTPPFSADPHTDAGGNILIDSGRMILEPPDPHQGTFWTLSDFEGKMVTSPDLPELLLIGLQMALRRDFVDHH